MGTEVNIKRAGIESYTSQEISQLKEVRTSIEMPRKDTVMQKVIGVDTGDIQMDLKAYLNSTNRETGARCDCKIYGFVAKASDAAPFMNTPQQCYDNLRLDYTDTLYKDPDQAVYLVRYTGDPGKYSVPFGKEFGGNRTDDPPFTGNGFTEVRST